MVDKIVDYKGSHEDLFLWNQNVLSIFVNQIDSLSLVFF